MTSYINSILIVKHIFYYSSSVFPSISLNISIKTNHILDYVSVLWISWVADSQISTLISCTFFKDGIFI